MVEEREKVLEKAYDKGFEYEKEYGFCSQAVLSAIQDVFGGVDNKVIESSHALAGGGALVGDGTCGACAGSMMAISAFFGRNRDQFNEGEIGDWMKSSEVSKKVRERFSDEFGSVICNDIQEDIFGRSYNLWDSEDFKAFEDAGAHEDKCPSVTGRAAKWTAEILLEEGIEPK